MREEAVGNVIQTPQNAKRFHAFGKESPSTVLSSAFQSPLVSRLRNGFENKIVEPDSGSSGKKAPIKFQTVGSDIQTPQNAKKCHAFGEELPRLQLVDSSKRTSCVPFQSPLVSRLNNVFEDKFVQPDRVAKQASIKFQTVSSVQIPQNAKIAHDFDEEPPHLRLVDSSKRSSSVSFQSPSVPLDSGTGGGIAKPAPVKFQTAGGRSLSISSDALKRARSLLGDPDLGDFFDGGDSVFSIPDKRQTNTISSSVERSESNKSHTPLIHQITPEGNHNHMAKSFTSPLQPSRQMDFSNKLRYEGNGNNLIMEFDDAVKENDCGRKSSNTPGQKPLHNRNEVVDTTIKSSVNGLSSRMDPRGKPLGRALVDISNTINALHTNSKQPASGKRRLGLNLTVSPFKKPRISNISGDQDVQFFPNGMHGLGFFSIFISLYWLQDLLYSFRYA